MARLAKFYKYDLEFLENYFIEFIEHYGSQMNPFLRKRLVSGIMILRSQNLILPLKCLKFLIKLFDLKDKELRTMVTSFIMNDIKRMNKHHKNVTINK